MGDREEGDEHVDQAFVLRLPNSMADKVRGMIRADDLSQLNLRVDPISASNQFKGRQGAFTIKGDTQLPASVMELPTLVEAYRVIDGRSGDYIKCCEISQVVVVHETVEDAAALRTARPSGRMNSGITPPTHKILREFAKTKPHYTQLKKLKKTNPKNAIKRAENHILRINNKGDGDTELEEVEIECESPRNDMDQDVVEQEEMGGGLPYKGKDGNLYYMKNSRAYKHDTNERVGFLATKVRFKLKVEDHGVITVAQCDMPRKLRVPEYAQQAAAGEEVDEEELDAEIEGKVTQADTDLAAEMDQMLDVSLEEGEEQVAPQASEEVDGENQPAAMEEENVFGDGTAPEEAEADEFGNGDEPINPEFGEESQREQDELATSSSHQHMEPNQSFAFSDTGVSYMDSDMGGDEPAIVGPEEGMMPENQNFDAYDERTPGEVMEPVMEEEAFDDPGAEAETMAEGQGMPDEQRAELEAKVKELEERVAQLEEALEKQVQNMNRAINPVMKKRMQPAVEKAQAERDAAVAELEQARAELGQ